MGKQTVNLSPMFFSFVNEVAFGFRWQFVAIFLFFIIIRTWLRCQV